MLRAFLTGVALVAAGTGLAMARGPIAQVSFVQSPFVQGVTVPATAGQQPVMPRIFLASGPAPAPGPTITSADGSIPNSNERMQKRFPQPVRVGFLIGLPVLDWDDSTIGYVQDLVRDSNGRILMIVPYRRWFGWASNGGPLDFGRRLVAIPLDTSAILARQIDVLDVSRDDIDRLPTWTPSQGQPIGRDDIIKIAITRR